jgi:hypothetical protein
MLICFDLFGLAPGDKFPTSEDAAKDACNYIYPKTAKDQVEYGGWIEKAPDGSFTYKEPTKGEKNKANMPQRPENGTAMFHSHNKGPGNEYFSGSNQGVVNKLLNARPGREKEGDTFTADRVACPSYLVTPKGDIKRYDPDPKKEGKGKISTVGHVNEK